MPRHYRLVAVVCLSSLSIAGCAGSPGGTHTVGEEATHRFTPRPPGRPFAQSDDPAYRMTPAAYADAVAHRDRLPPAPLGPRAAQSDALFAPWQFIGPKQFTRDTVSLSGRINAVAFDPTHNGTWWAGAPYGGVWKSTDFGNTWKPMSDGWSSEEVTSIAVDPHDGDVVYVGTGDLFGNGFAPQGLMKTSDGGSTWTNLGPAGETVTRIIVGGDSKTVLAATASRLIRSTDGGTTWSTIPGSSGIEWTDIAVGAPNFFFPAHWYAVGSGTGGTIWSSTDGGATWSTVKSPFSATAQSRLAVASSRVHPGYVVVATPNGDQKIYASGDFGSTWKDITGNMNPHQTYQGGYSYGLAITTVGDTALGGTGTDLIWHIGTYVYQSTADGNWTLVNNGHDDVHAIAVNPFSQYSLLIGNDGGAFNLTYQPELGTTTTVGLNQTIGVTEVYDFAYFPGNEDWLTVGTQDTGTVTDHGNLASWVETFGQDGGGVAINPNDVNTQYASENMNVGGRHIRRTTHDFVGDTSTDITPSIGTEQAEMNEPMLLDPNNPKLMYMATSWLYRWDESTQQWTSHLGNTMLSPNSTVNAVAIAPSDSNRIYVASGEGLLWMSKDGGASFTAINGNLTGNLPFTSLSVNPSDENDVIAGIWRGVSAHLWRTTNPTATQVSWSDVGHESTASGLPNNAVNTIARDPANPGSSWYAGTDVGVLYTNDSGAHWYDATLPLGLPGVPVAQLIVTKGSWLVAATYGRGVWRVRLGCSPKTCAALGANCGHAGDGCGGTLDCGSCQFPSTCGGSGVPNVCGACRIVTCQMVGATCGTVDADCGQTLNCGSCAAGLTCADNHCVAKCVPKIHCHPGQCGTIDDDGCGNQLCCGSPKHCCL